MINLLHHHLKVERQNNRKFSELLFFFFIILLFSLTIYGALIVFEVYKKQDNDRLDKAILEVEADIVKHKELEKDISYINQQLNLIDSVIVTRQQWSKVIIEFASRTPKSIKVEALNFSAVGSAQTTEALTVGEVTISGIARTLDDIEIFRKSLDASDVFDNSAFQSASFKPEESTFSFKMTTEIIEGKVKK
jgi:Tfp pilus assembly protein PilN